jgi:hypothetical protein
MMVMMIASTPSENALIRSLDKSAPFFRLSSDPNSFHRRTKSTVSRPLPGPAAAKASATFGDLGKKSHYIV